MRVKSNSPSETRQIGSRIGRLLAPGDIVCLYGGLGAGKTTLVKGIASAFGIEDRDITSASYTVIAEYDVTPRFCHIDLYRITDQNDLDSTGIWDILGGDTVSVIEWAEHIDGLQGLNPVSITIGAEDDDSREILLEGLNEDAWNNL